MMCGVEILPSDNTIAKVKVIRIIQALRATYVIRLVA
jgi:hypothetical protein